MFSQFNCSPRSILLSLALLGMALPHTAKAENSERSDLLLMLIRENGCQMSNAEAQEILPEHAFTQDETRDIIRIWEENGLVEAKGLSITLSQKGCTG